MRCFSLADGRAAGAIGKRGELVDVIQKLIGLNFDVDNRIGVGKREGRHRREHDQLAFALFLVSRLSDWKSMCLHSSQVCTNASGSQQFLFHQFLSLTKVYKYWRTRQKMYISFAAEPTFCAHDGQECSFL